MMKHWLCLSALLLLCTTLLLCVHGLHATEAHEHHDEDEGVDLGDVTGASEALDDCDDTVGSLVGWALEQGLRLHVNLTCGLHPLRGQLLHAEQPVKSGDLLMLVPPALLMTGGKAMEELGDVVCGKLSSPDMCLAVWLIIQRQRGEDSAWAPYVATLPTTVQSIYTWSNDEIDAWGATSVWEHFKQARFLARKAWHVIKGQKQGFVEPVTREDLDWAMSIVASRAVIHPDPAQGVALVPLYDMFPHQVAPNPRMIPCRAVEDPQHELYGSVMFRSVFDVEEAPLVRDYAHSFQYMAGWSGVWTEDVSVHDVVALEWEPILDDHLNNDLQMRVLDTVTNTTLTDAKSAFISAAGPSEAAMMLARFCAAKSQLEHVPAIWTRITDGDALPLEEDELSALRVLKEAIDFRLELLREWKEDNPDVVTNESTLAYELAGNVLEREEAILDLASNGIAHVVTEANAKYRKKEE